MLCRAVTVLMASACGPAPGPEELGSMALGIVEGASSREAAAVAIFGDEQLACSGVVVAPLVVLTAAHCVFGDPHDGERPFERMAVAVGPDAHAPSARLDVSSVWVHPEWSPLFDAFDLAALALSEPAPVTPAAVTSASLRPIGAGDGVRVVGYGSESVTDRARGVRLEASTTVQSVGPWTFETSEPATPCQGDSGGPVFVGRQGSEVVAGLNARSDCSSRAIHTHLAMHAEVLSLVSSEPSPIEPDAGTARDDAVAIRDERWNSPARCNLGPSSPGSAPFSLALWLVVSVARAARRACSGSCARGR
jgi:hypothetical protein